MSGHSKWSTIKHKKGKTDAKRGKIFTKVIREIQSAVKTGNSGDPEMNPRLRMAIVRAKDVNMPSDNVKRAIQKALGGEGVAALEEVVYEGYGPGGVAILINCLTDNKNRTLPVVRNILSKNGGNLANAGSVNYLFAQKGQLIFAPEIDENNVMETAIDAGAEDVRNNDDGSLEVLCAPGHLEKVREAFEQSGIAFETAEVTMLPDNTIELNEEDAQKVLKIIDALEDEDDVQDVYSNFDIPDEIMGKIS